MLLHISCQAISLSFSLPLELMYRALELYLLYKSNSKQRYTCWKGTFHHSLTVLVCYRFPLHKKHQYLAFDVSLPPPCNLSCSPKQLDSDNDDLEFMQCILICVQTWLSHSMVMGIRLRSSAKMLDFLAHLHIYNAIFVMHFLLFLFFTTLLL